VRIKKYLILLTVSGIIMNSCTKEKAHYNEMLESIQNFVGFVDLSCNTVKQVPVTSSLVFAPTCLYAASTYALLLNEDGTVTYLYMGGEQNYSDFKEYQCAGIVEDLSEPGIITGDLTSRVGQITAEELKILFDDTVARGEMLGEGVYSLYTTRKEQESWKDVCQMISDEGIWYAALKTDGTVFTLNVFSSYSPPDIEEWTDIVHIESDGSHLFGLKSDGTVCAHFGTMSAELKKTYGEEIAGWRDLVQITGGGKVTGLKSDGTVVTMRRGIYTACEEWSGIRQIAASRYAIVGLKEDGTIVAVCSKDSAFGEEDFFGWEDIERIAVCDNYCIAVSKAGRVYRTNE